MFVCVCVVVVEQDLLLNYSFISNNIISLAITRSPGQNKARTILHVNSIPTANSYLINSVLLCHTLHHLLMVIVFGLMNIRNTIAQLQSYINECGQLFIPIKRRILEIFYIYKNTLHFVIIVKTREPI